MNKTNYTLTISLAISTFFITSCKDKKSPGFEYMPDMYRSPAVEAYTDTLGSLQPVEGTIVYSNDAAKAYLNFPYPYPNNNEGYETAGKNLKNPLQKTEINLAKGKELYEIFCDHCHGESGKGDGMIIKNKKFPNPPSFSTQLKDLVEGKMYHTITHGKNMMGSHASQLNPEERWKIIMYLQTLQKEMSIVGVKDTLVTK